MADPAPKQPTDTKEDRAPCAATRAHKPWPRPTKCAGRSVQPDPLADGVPILLESPHLVFECDDVRSVTPEFHTDPTDFGAPAAPDLDSLGHLAWSCREVPAPRKNPNIKRRELV